MLFTDLFIRPGLVEKDAPFASNKTKNTITQIEILPLDDNNNNTIVSNNIDVNKLLEENKLLIIDTKTYHAAVTATDTDRRIVINFNYL